MDTMNNIERLAMYREKQGFIRELSKAFSDYHPEASTVQKIDYRLFVAANGERFSEWVVVTFIGGAISPRRITGNSNTANFRTIGRLIDGGYYDEVEDFKNLEQNGFIEVNLLEA